MYKQHLLINNLVRKNLTSKRFEIINITRNKHTRIDKILIANRGEIACRITRTARRLGVKTVGVFSEVDRDAMHVNLTDEAYCIGPAPSNQSYLRQDKIISIAKQSKCQAIHPGYGFLSENVEFAELCQKSNIIFIGPPAQAIRDMGIKSTSKAIMSEAGVPIIEGYHGEDQSDETLLAKAKVIGFPLMIKAVRGGGGKGMRIALKESEFHQALESARTESQKAFGDSAVLLEKYVAEPRHVEVQVFADHYGNAVHLFERDCSVQRRHQKIIEEAPAPGISEELRLELGSAAVRAAKAVGYVGAGTVEFILDRRTHNFHFMEMNTRLQVEHPITEAITGTDLVEWQLKVAAGEKLPMQQEDIQLRGHAFEARIYAEEPRNNFLPGAGKLSYLVTPSVADNVRVETGVRQNDQVSVHYDPMIAKLVVWGQDRTSALRILHSKLSEYNIAGLETNVEFLKDLCSNEKFQNGDVHTGFIEENYELLFPKLQVPSDVLAQGTLGLILNEELEAMKKSIETDDPFSPFATETGVRVNHALMRNFQFLVGEEKFVTDVQYVEPDVFMMRINNLGPWRKVTGTMTIDGKTMKLNTEIDGVIQQVNIAKLDDQLVVFSKDRSWKLNAVAPNYISKLGNNSAVALGAAVSPIPGIVDKILIKDGDNVNKGDPLLVIVAMKMEYIIKASSDGEIDRILCKIGDNVAKDKLLVKMKNVTAND
ncbi:methylcrotonoyl-CoA carboxylase subunit alpha, mitochondrial [Leptopilina heterotoma]|uniref:methylcrotonoyl-CoA carboxylase subunit alpha, mitochondrial n=1 Tax=Leptopilina heterotoma TaxID=63436 RepID=UPI001CA86484|nr:methylcrotonoyl-CoA carboxylase subunit alpha, mitochondrial [Leptopilina heterotoma]